jgi:hypothetical protein
VEESISFPVYIMLLDRGGTQLGKVGSWMKSDGMKYSGDVGWVNKGIADWNDIYTSKRRKRARVKLELEILRA